MSAGHGTILSMPVVLLLAALAILAGVVVVAVGRGGELTMFRPDSLADSELATAADVAAFRPPPAFFGYSAPATDEALQRITEVVAERDAEVAYLRGQIAQLRGTDAGQDWADSGPQGKPDPASWPDAWTYGGSRGQAEAYEDPAPEVDAGRVGGAETASWAGPEAYAEPERRADPADWPPPAVEAESAAEAESGADVAPGAEPEHEAEAAIWPESGPYADAVWPATEYGQPAEGEPGAEPAPEPSAYDTSREPGQP
jgi:hypothetical protein